MAVFASSALTMRRKLIIQALRDAGATRPEAAVRLSETNLVNPGSFQEYTKQLVDLGAIRKTSDGKYYVEKQG